MPKITIGANSYDVYSSLDNANEFLAADFSASKWRAEADDDALKRALVSAARLLDRQSWPGSKEDEDQLPAWPRTGVTGIEDGEIPQAVVDANALLAKYIHEGQAIETSTTTASNIKRQKAGSVEQEFFYPFGSISQRLPLPVSELLRGLLGGGERIAGSLAYGTDGCSVADDSFRPSGGI